MSNRSHRLRSLRVRLTMGFAVGGLLLSAVFASVTYVLVQTYLVRDRDEAALRQTYANARLVRDALTQPGLTPAAALDGIDAPANAPALLERSGRWFGRNAGFGPDNVPQRLRTLVERDQPARQRVVIRGETKLVVGVPIVAANAGFYEMYSMREVASTLTVLRWSLFGGAVSVSAAAALLGVWAGRRVVQPLREVSDAAVKIAGGELSTRLTPPGDPDLDGLVTSFNTMVDALEARLERDARFATDVAHELRSPLTTLATSVQVLEGRRDSMNERDRMALDLLVREIARFQALVRDLLELGRADAGVDRMHIEPVRVGALVEHALALNGLPDFPVEIDADAATTPVMLDKRRMERVLGNVVDNARTHGGGVTGIAIRHVDECLRITVCDAGPGVPADERTAVFDRFNRGSAAGRRASTSGSGIGLALVAEHVRAHDGRVWVEGGPDGAGAQFVIEVPWRPA